jgi:hypothetical protein
MNAVRPVIASYGVPLPQMRSVESHNTSGREKEGKRKGLVEVKSFMRKVS